MIEKKDFAGLRHRILTVRGFAFTYRESHRGEHGGPSLPEKHWTIGVHRVGGGDSLIAEHIRDNGPGSRTRELNFARSVITDIEVLRADLERDRRRVPA